ncbi:MAG: cation diffusion facilitator family transporter [Deltaproteobacteria bacterium]|jgi:cation diffusion facilitator family transporter|nr:cation diffusion facilitator family transporter [Deltaproteobacteria bacterium]
MTSPLLEKKKAATLSIYSNSGLIIVKLIAGFMTGSVAIISEAVHSFLDLMAAMMAWGAVRISENPPDFEHPYGHGKTENISALFEAILIVVGGAFILKEAIFGLIEPRELPSLKAGVAVMFLSTLVNYLISRRLFQIGQKSGSEALTADAWHLRTDVYASLGVFLALAAIEIGRLIAPSVNLAFVDSAVAGLVSLLILKTGLTLGWDASKGLVDHSLPAEDQRIVVDCLRELYPSIRGFRSLKTRRSGPYRLILVDILVDGELTVNQAHGLGVQFSLKVAQRLPKTEVTFHLEPVNHPQLPALDPTIMD